MDATQELDRIVIRIERRTIIALTVLRHLWLLLGLAFFAGFFLGMGVAGAGEPVVGFATYYTAASCRHEGTSGVWTANGERYDETAFTAAVPGREFGHRYQVCRVDAQPRRCITVRINDVGPGRRARQQRVVIDLSPAAYDALGGTRGVNRRGVAWGRLRVSVERIR
jgi:rare lipoprotein A (peptidoglycan hydrolase)